MAISAKVSSILLYRLRRSRSGIFTTYYAYLPTIRDNNIKKSKDDDGLFKKQQQQLSTFLLTYKYNKSEMCRSDLPDYRGCHFLFFKVNLIVSEV